MGAGLIALGLWFLLGLKIDFNGAEFIPPIIAYVIFIWGIITILKRYKNKYLSYSLVLAFICLLFEVLPELKVFYILSCIAAVLQLYFMLYGIKDIANNYDDIIIYTQKIKRYSIIFAILNIMIIISIVFNNEVIAGALLAFILFLYTISICKHLYRINDYLYLLDEPVKISKPLSRKKLYKVTAIIIMILSMTALLFSQNILTTLTNQYSYDSYYMVFKGENKNIKVEDLEIYGHNQYDLPYYGWFMSLPHLQVYASPALLKDAESMKSKIYLKDSQDFLYESYDSISSKKSTDTNFMKCETVNEAISPFQYNDQILEDIQKGKVTLYLSLMFLDSDDNEIDTQIIELKPVSVKEYGYEDQNLIIKNIFVSEHTLMLESSYVRVKPSYYPSFHQNTRIEVEILDEKRSLISFDVDQDSTELVGAIYRGEMKSQPKIRINIYEDDKLLDTKDYVLEVIQ